MAAAQKKADDRTALAEQKLASVGQLEEENAKMKSALNEANKECMRLKKDNQDVRHRSQEGRSGELSEEPGQEVVHQA